MQSSELKVEGPLILDEPFKHISEHYIDRVAEFLKQVSSAFGRQIIMITHNRHLIEVADRWYKVSWNNGISSVEVDVLD